MLNTNAFWLVIHENKVFEILSNVFLFCPLLGPKRGQTLYFEQIQSYFVPSLVEIGLVVIEKMF